MLNSIKNPVYLFFLSNNRKNRKTGNNNEKFARVFLKRAFRKLRSSYSVMSK